MHQSLERQENVVLRVAYFGTYSHSRYVFDGNLPQVDGMPRGVGADFSAATELYARTDNKGNMIHGEAPARIIDCDRSRSCYVSVEALDNASHWPAERIADELSTRFDLVVYSTANAIRPNLNPGCTAQVLDGLRCKFIVLGMGMQNSLPPTTEGLHPNLVSLLEVCDRKAAIFGVRGLETERWLKEVGFGKAKALGCPSFFVYPKNVLGIQAPDPLRVRNAITGGYIHGKVPRATALLRLFEGFEAHYVMQEELPILKSDGLIGDDPDLYNDATGELRKESIDNALEHIHRRKIPFASYRWFLDPNAWRQFASHFDFYLGDRLHGGVAAMQSGVASLLLAEDQRVMEIADFFSLPRIATKDALNTKLPDILAERLNEASVSAMKDAYAQRLSNFVQVFRDADVPLAASVSSAATAAAQSHGGHVFPMPVFPRPTAYRRLKDWVADFVL